MLRGGGLIRPNRRARPIDKKIQGILRGGTDVVFVDIFEAKYPVTLTGIKWEIVAQTTNTNDRGFFRWALEIKREGTATFPLNTVDGEPMDKNPSDIIAHGSSFIGFGQQVGGVNISSGLNEEGMTKVGRKLQDGDKLIIKMTNTYEGQALILVDWRAYTQFFLKS